MHPVMATKAGVVGSMIIDIQGDRLDAFMIDRFGAIRDHFRISKAPRPVPTTAPLGQAALVVLVVSLGGMMLRRLARSRSAFTA